jgi:hypothetical protein
MTATDREHTFVWDGETLLPCACGVSRSAVQAVLDAAADDARRIVGDAYYTGCRVRPESETLELWSCGAPPQVLQELEAIRPGVYAIHNDAPRTLTELLELMHSIDLSALRSEGIELNRIGPRLEGHLGVGVSSDVAAAQAWFDAEYEDGLFRVFAAEPIRLQGGRRGQVEVV